MEFKVNRVRASLALAQSFETCNAKAKGDIDSFLLFRESKGDIMVYSMNDRAEQVVRLPVEDLQAENGEEFCVSGQFVIELLRQFTEEEILVKTDTGNAIFKSPRRKSIVQCPLGEASDFVLMQIDKTGAEIECTSKLISESFKTTAFSASKNYKDAPLTSVQLKIQGAVISAVASDNLRISRYKGTLDTDTGGDFEFLVPKETANTLGKLLAGQEKVTIQPCKRHLKLLWEDTEFIASIENGVGKPYPVVGRFMDANEVIRFKISREELLRTAKMAMLVAKDTYIVLRSNKDVLHVITQERDRGASVDEVVVESVTGTCQDDVIVPCQVLLKGIENISDPWVELVFREIQEGMLAVTLESGDYQHLIFPVEPNDEQEYDEENEDGYEGEGED
jgi:DNA polymerase III sliding clamp (beta) subunit (PCNA family)